MQQEIVDQQSNSSSDEQLQQLALAAGYDYDTLMSLPENIRQEILDQARRDSSAILLNPSLLPSSSSSSSSSSLPSFTLSSDGSLHLQGYWALYVDIPTPRVETKVFENDRLNYGEVHHHHHYHHHHYYHHHHHHHHYLSCI